MLNWIIDSSLRGRFLVLLGALTLAAAGALALTRLDVDAFPDTTPVQVQINTTAPSLGPEEVETQITFPVEQALGCVFGYGVGLDMTRRDLQGKAKEMGRPWEVGKAFECSAPCSALVPASRIGHPSSGAIWLDVNGRRRQTGDLNQLIWKVPEMISCLSGLFRLAPGDVIMSGTPAGVAAVERGDLMRGHVEGVGDLEVRVV